MTNIEKVSYLEAVSIMQSIRKETDEVGVFTDAGWGDVGNDTIYEIIKNGDGQKPIASINKDTFLKLLDNKIIAGNSLKTYKARTYHNFVGVKNDKH